ncbi:hypothetical protein IFR05_002884 [Cadophora sp. M221]|nr:hypothetical protein IFR05_002884 [Cadophora sp. M221]
MTGSGTRIPNIFTWRAGDAIRKDYKLPHAEKSAIVEKLSSSIWSKSIGYAILNSLRRNLTVAVLVEIAKAVSDAWTERFDHIDDHFVGRNCMIQQSIQEWIPVDDNKPKGPVAVPKKDVQTHLEKGKDGYEFRELNGAQHYEWKGLLDQSSRDPDASIESEGAGFSHGLEHHDQLRSSHTKYGNLGRDDDPNFSIATNSGTHPTTGYSEKHPRVQKHPHLQSGFGKETRPTDDKSPVLDAGKIIQRSLKFEKNIGSTVTKYRKSESNEDDSRSSRQINKEKSPSTASMSNATNVKHEKPEVVSEYVENPEDSRNERITKSRLFEEVLDGVATADDLECRGILDRVEKTEVIGSTSEDTKGIIWRFFDQCSLVLAVSASTLGKHPEILNPRS